MKQLSGEEYLNIVDRYYSVLVFFAQKWVHEKAEDVVQESFMKLIRHSELFGPPDNVSSWLFKVVRTTAIDWLRKSESQERLNKEFSQHKPNWFEDRPENRLEAQEVSEKLAQLPIELREIVEMRIWGTLSFDEIAESIQQSRTTVWRRYNEALEILRNKLSQ